MKLIAFKIENFKSIVNTEWISIPRDGILCLIGQNEAGKSSILEALYSYEKNELESDFMRNDMALPKVYCIYELDKKEVDAIVLPFSKSDGFKELTEIIHGLGNKITISSFQKGGKELDFSYFEYDEILENFLTAQPDMPKEALAEVADDPEEKKKLIDRYKLGWAEFAESWALYRPEFIFFNDEAALLPNDISLKAISSDKSASGKQAALNLLSVAGIDVSKLSSDNERVVKQYMERANKKITANFQDFWTQKIGKSSKIEVEIELKNRPAGHEEPGQPFLQFWIKDGEHTLHPKQRSKGVRWFLSFYLSLKADAIHSKKSKSIFLIDEPGANLHARAQEDVLKVFEEIHKTNQIIYTTHSQYLIEFKNIHRLVAVQRRNETDEASDTIVMPAYHLGSASTNTLAPILGHMGIDFSNQNVIAKRNNIILEEISALYYMQAFSLMVGKGNCNYVPATGVANIEQLVLLFIGWGLEYGVVFDDDSAGRTAYQNISKNIYLGSEALLEKHLYRIKKCNGIEDLFTSHDFINCVLLQTVDEKIKDKPNSEIAKLMKVSKPMLALNFFLSVKEGKLDFKNLQDESKAAIDNLMSHIQRLLDAQQ